MRKRFGGARRPDRPLEDLETCNFPKHAGVPWVEVVEIDRPYVEWLIGGTGPSLQPDLEDHLTDLLENY